MSSIRERRQLKHHNNQNNSSQQQKQSLNANGVYNQTIILHSPQFSINNTYIHDQNANNMNNQSINYYQINQQANIENINNQNILNTPQYNANQDQSFNRNQSKNSSAQGKVYINRKLSYDKQLMNFFPPKHNQATITYEINDPVKLVENPNNQQLYTTINNANPKEYNTIQYNSLQPPSENVNTSRSKGKNNFRKNSVKRPSMNSPPLNYIPQPPPPLQHPAGILQLNAFHNTKTQQLNKENSSIEFQTAFVIPDNPQNLQNLFFAQNPDLNSKPILEKKSKEKLDKNIQLIQIYGNKTIKRSQNQIPILNQSGQLQNYYVPQEQRQSKSTGRHHSVLRRRQVRDSTNQINSCNESQTIQHQKNYINPYPNYRSISHERQSLYSNLRQQNSKGYFESLRVEVSGERKKTSAPRGIKYQSAVAPITVTTAQQPSNNINSQQNSVQQLPKQNQSQNPSQPQRAKSFGRTRAYKFPNNSCDKQTIKQPADQQFQKHPPHPIRVKYPDNYKSDDPNLMRNDSGENINYQSQQSDYLEQYIGAIVYQENMSTSNYDRLSSHMDKLSQKIYTQQSEIKNQLQPLSSAQNSDLLKQNDSSQINRFSFDQNFDPNRSFNDLPSAMDEKRQEETDNEKYSKDLFEKEEKSIEQPLFTPSIYNHIGSQFSEDSKQRIQNYHIISQEIKEDSHLLRPQGSNIPQQQSHYSSINSFGCQNSYLGESKIQDKVAFATINEDSQQFNLSQVEVIEESIGIQATYQPKDSFFNKNQQKQSNISKEINFIDESIIQQSSSPLSQIQQKPKHQPHPPQLQKAALRSQASIGSQGEEVETLGQVNRKQKQAQQQVTFCDSPIIMEPKQQPLAVAEDKKFKRNAAKIYKRNDLLNKDTLRDSKEDINLEKVQQMKLILQFQVGDKKTLIPRKPSIEKIKNNLTLQYDVLQNKNTKKIEENNQSIDDKGSDLNPVDELSTYKEERNLLDDNEEIDNSKKSLVNTQFDQMIITSLNNYLNKTETDQDLKTKSDGYFQHYKH